MKRQYVKRSGLWVPDSAICRMNPALLGSWPKPVSGGGGGGGDITTGLIAWWKLDDGSGTTPVDSSGTGNNGTFVGSPTWTTGHIGGGLSFNGSSQYVTAATTGMGSLTTATLAAWMNRSSTGNQVSLGAGSNSTNDRFTFQWFTDGNCYFTFGNGSGIQYAFCAANVTGWHHFAMVFDGSQAGNARIAGYIDGVLKTLTYNTSPPSSLSSSASLGNFVMGTNANLSGNSTGIVDDVRFYNVAKNATDIAALAAM